LATSYGISNLPTLAVLRAEGQPVTGTTGFLDAGQFVRFLRDARKKLVAKK
jgi:thioredoxin-like negative regulator of GroEL